jgi:hypothetical protein
MITANALLTLLNSLTSSWRLLCRRNALQRFLGIHNITRRNRQQQALQQAAGVVHRRACAVNGELGVVVFGLRVPASA